MYNRYRLHSMPSAQCYVTIQHDSDSNRIIIELTSYDTLVVCAILDSDSSLRLLCSGTYSTTTARHINRFTTEFFGENLYSDCKRVTKNIDSKIALCIRYCWFYEVFHVLPCDELYSRYSSKFLNTVDMYEHDSFGIGAVKLYRGHY